MLSVTTVVPGLSSAIKAAAMATMPFRLISQPFSSTAEDLSTSVSKMRPKSVSASLTREQIASIAFLSSGFGAWFGKVPSGSKNWLEEMSAPRGSSTFVAKKPPEPLPASTVIFIPVSGFSPSPVPSIISLRRWAEYVSRSGISATSPGVWPRMEFNIESDSA